MATTYDYNALSHGMCEPLEPLSEGVAVAGRSDSTAEERRNLLDAVDTPSDLKALEREVLPEFCRQLRGDLIDLVSATGGHLGSGLGVVELTVALHRVFDTPTDKIVWDVSHQCYPHKMLTGRRDRMAGLRKGGGLSGFTCRTESEFDPFGAAHSSTAISAALGFATARDFKGGREAVVAVVGDGAMSGGMAFEGINNLGAQKRNVVIVINDNDMSIAPPSGALAEHLRDLRRTIPERGVRRAALARGDLPSFAGETTVFDTLGVRYAGPFDGHDVDELLSVFEAAKAVGDGPVVVHVLTEKGHGYAPAEAAADCMHGVAQFDVDTGAQKKSAPKAPSYTSIFAKGLIAEAAADHRVVAVTAAMPSGTGLDKFADAFPERCFDAGIAEQHAVTFAAGLACEGLKPFAAIYSTFLQRGYDQVVHDVAIQSLPVRFAIDRAGLVGADGVTHQGSYDVAYLGCLPGFVLMAASDEAELMHMVATAAAIDDRPSAFRYPRGEGRGVGLPERGQPLEIGKGQILREGGRVAILSYGSLLGDSLGAADDLDALGYGVTVADARFAKPIDDELVRCLLLDHEVVITLEAGSVGGFSALVYDSLARQRITTLAGRVVPMYMSDCFIEHHTPAAQLERAGLARKDIVERALAALGHQTFEPVMLQAGE